MLFSISGRYIGC